MSSVAVVSLDLHKKFSKAVVMDAEGNVLDERKISHASFLGERRAPFRDSFTVENPEEPKPLYTGSALLLPRGDTRRSE